MGYGRSYNPFTCVQLVGTAATVQPGPVGFKIASPPVEQTLVKVGESHNTTTGQWKVWFVGGFRCAMRK